MKKNVPILARVPTRMPQIRWQSDSGSDTVTLLIENTGWANRLAQRLFRRPRYSQVHLDRLGSFVWQLLDGQQDVAGLSRQVEARFGADATPVYVRLVGFLKMLHSYHFIRWQ